MLGLYFENLELNGTEFRNSSCCDENPYSVNVEKLVIYHEYF